jgi:membrane peptidoglycan carboxypeptidase
MTIARTYRYRRLRLARGRPPGARSPLLALLFLPMLLGGLFLGAGGVGLGAAYLMSASGVTQTPAEAISNRGGGARIYDRNGVLLYEFLDEDYGHQVRVSLDDVSPLIQDATIAAEDASFRTNPGVNVRGLARASIENLKPGESFMEGTGGSSITQQLVKQLYFTPEGGASGLSAARSARRRSRSRSRRNTRRTRSSSGTSTRSRTAVC